MKKSNPFFALKPALIIAVSLIGIFLLLFSARQFLLTSDYFKVKDIVITGGADEGQLLYLKGRNIWQLDLRKESRFLSLVYPEYQKIDLVRVFPNRVFIYFQKRTPVALVKLAHYFYVDAQQVLFDVSAQAREAGLPVITGLAGKLIAPSAGKRYNIAELALALDIIKEFRKIRSLAGLKIWHIDVESASCASFFLSDKLQVKIDRDGLKDKMDILSQILIQSGRDIADIKYIDLRFKDPVVKLR